MEAKPKAKGTRMLAQHREGKRLTKFQAMLAKCSDCCCQYADGMVDCQVSSCPLHPFMPYRAAGRRESILAPTPPVQVAVPETNPSETGPGQG